MKMNKCFAHGCWILLLIGCEANGPGLYPASGSVTFDGQPVESGFITFTPIQSPGAARAAKISGGQYSAELPEGRMKVSISANRFIGGTDSVMGARPQEQYIPVKYNSKSKLTAEVQAAGENTFDFSLEKNR